MKSKKKRDERAEREKERLLDPAKLEEKKKKKRKEAALAAASWILVFAVMICLTFQLVRAAGKNSLRKAGESIEPAFALMEAESQSPEDDGWQEGWVKHEGRIYAYNEDIMTFLVMGIDKDSDVKKVAEGTDGGSADALFLAVMNPHDKTIKVIGINRNTMTDIDLYNEEGAYINTVKAQIAVQHGFGNGMEESCEYQKRAVQRLLYNLPIHGYAAVNMSAIPTINDAVGGVEVTVLEDLTAKDSSLVKGEKVHLTGQSAFWYVKYRNTDEFASADGRLARQKQYLEAFIGKAKKTVKEDISAALDLYRAVSNQMVTDITINEAAYLAPLLADYRFGIDSFYLLEGETVMGEQFEEFYVDEDALYEMILEVFYEEVERE